MSCYDVALQGVWGLMDNSRSPGIADLENRLNGLRSSHTKEFGLALTEPIEPNQSIQVEELDQCYGDGDSPGPKQVCEDCMTFLHQRENFFNTKLNIANAQICKLEDMVSDIKEKQQSNKDQLANECLGNCPNSTKLKKYLEEREEKLKDLNRDHQYLKVAHNEIVRQVDTMTEDLLHKETKLQRFEQINSELQAQVHHFNDLKAVNEREILQKTSLTNALKQRVNQLETFHDTNTHREQLKQNELSDLARAKKQVEEQLVARNQAFDQLSDQLKKSMTENKDLKYQLNRAEDLLKQEQLAGRTSGKYRTLSEKLTSDLELTKRQLEEERTRSRDAMKNFHSLKLDVDLEKRAPRKELTFAKHNLDSECSATTPLRDITEQDLSSSGRSVTNRLNLLKNKYIHNDRLHNDVLSSTSSSMHSENISSEQVNVGSPHTFPIAKNNRIRRASTNASFGMSSALNSTLYYSRDQREVIDSVENQITHLQRCKHENNLVLQSLVQNSSSSNNLNKHKVSEIEEENKVIDMKINECRIDLKFVKASVGEIEKPDYIK